MMVPSRESQLLQDMGFANGQRIKRKADGLTVEIKEVGVTQITCCCDGSEELLTIPYSSLQNREWKLEKNKPERLLADAKDVEKWKFLSQTSLLKAQVLVKLWEGAPEKSMVFHDGVFPAKEYRCHARVPSWLPGV